jgi:hypothetical protein
MTNKKRLLTAAVAGAFGLGLFATSSFAGPLVLGPATPKVMAVSVHTVPVKTQMINAYRQVRAFWLSRAIVR